MDDDKKYILLQGGGSSIAYNDNDCFVDGSSWKKDEHDKRTSKEIAEDLKKKYYTDFFKKHYKNLVILTAAGTSLDNGSNKGKTRDELWIFCKSEIDAFKSEIFMKWPSFLSSSRGVNDIEFGSVSGCILLGSFIWYSFMLADKIAPGSYDSVSFILGITEEKNKSNLFVNPPEMIMAWPAVLGGGYHYMMLNGKWKDTLGSLSPFNLHLGIGQLYSGNTYNTDSIYAFVQNYFRVNLPGSAFTLRDKDSLVFNLTMHIDRWFDTPHVYDFNFWGGHIMQKQPAMQTISENGCDVFQISKLP